MDGPDACLRCDGPIRWIDAWMGCPDGCTYCLDCGEELGGTCVNGCGSLARRASQAKPLPGPRAIPHQASPAGFK